MLGLGYPSFPQLGTLTTGGYGLAVVGDSRMEQIMADFSGSIWPSDTNLAHVKTGHFLNVAAALSGGALSLRGKMAISGQRSDQYLTLLPAAKATGARFIPIFGVVNDIAQSGTTGDTADTIFARISSAALDVRRSGAVPILFTEPGDISWSTTLVGMCHRYNQLLVEFIERSNGILLFDIATVIWDQAAASTTAIAFKTSFSSDGIHYSPFGNQTIGIAFSTFIAPYIQAYPDLFSSPTALNGAGGIQQVVNALFNSTITTGLPANYSGEFPSSFTGTNGTATIASSIIAAPDGVGKACKLDITGAPSAATIRIQQDLTPGNFAIGNYIDGGVKAIINSGADKLLQAGLWIFVNNQGTPVGDQYNGAGFLATAIHGKTQKQRTTPYALTSGFGGVSWQFRIIFSSAGDASVTLWNPWVRKRTAF